jgi:hypothetical protein
MFTKSMPSPTEKSHDWEREEAKWSLEESILSRILAKFPEKNAEKVIIKLLQELLRALDGMQIGEGFDGMLQLNGTKNVAMDATMSWSLTPFAGPHSMAGNQLPCAMNSDGQVQNSLAHFPLCEDFMDGVIPSMSPIQHTPTHSAQFPTTVFDFVIDELPADWYQHSQAPILSSPDFPHYPVSPQSPPVQYATHGWPTAGQLVALNSMNVNGIPESNIEYYQARSTFEEQ